MLKKNIACIMISHKTKFAEKIRISYTKYMQHISLENTPNTELESLLISLF